MVKREAGKIEAVFLVLHGEEHMTKWVKDRHVPRCCMHETFECEDCCVAEFGAD